MNINEEYGFVDLLINDDYLHGKFLNTFSLLEYTGARKIVKSQLENNIDLEVLNHMAEEIRHAQMFKRHAQKAYPSINWTFNEDDVFCYDLTRSYIGKLDRFCEEIVGTSSCYHIVSYVIEKRALSFYQYYSKVLTDNQKKISLRGLLAEEERHLEEMTVFIDKLVQPEILAQISSREAEIFEEFSNELSLEINKHINQSSSYLKNEAS